MKIYIETVTLNSCLVSFKVKIRNKTMYTFET